MSFKDRMETTTNLNPLLQVTTWLLLAIATLLFGFRQLTRFYIKVGKPFGWEDVLLAASYLTGIGESVTILLPQGVVGKDISGISNMTLREAQKANYARDLLFILCLGFSKLSVLANLLSISPKSAHRRLTYALLLFAVAWTTTSFIGTAFQCGSHGPWESDHVQCINQKSFLLYVGITNILTDIVLLAVPIAIIYPLKMTLRVRLAVLGFYMTRILVIAAAIIQLSYLPGLFHDNSTLDSFPYYVSVQVVQFTSIMAACAVYFWPLLQSLQSGLMLANNPKSPHSHASARQSKSRLPFFRNDTTTQDSNQPQQSGYIEITTDVDIGLTTGPAKAHIPPNHIYNFTWELVD